MEKMLVEEPQMNEACREETYQPKRNIEIIPLDYGYIVNVGCQRIAIEDKKDLIKYLVEYLENPSEVERKYNRNELLDKQIPTKTR